MSDEERSLPLGLVMIGVMLIVLAFFWCCAASGYATEIEGQTIGRVSGPRQMGIAALAFFLLNGLAKLASLPAVVSFTLTRQWWIVIGLLVVEALVLIGFVGIKAVERSLEGPPKKKRKRK